MCISLNPEQMRNVAERMRAEGAAEDAAKLEALAKKGNWHGFVDELSSRETLAKKALSDMYEKRPMPVAKATEVPTPDFLVRLRAEVADLATKLDKLVIFQSTEAFRALLRVEQRLLIRQHKAMMMYKAIVGERLERTEKRLATK